MPNDKEKLARFEKAIFAEVNEKASVILAEVEAQQKEMLAKAEEEAKVEAEKQAKEELEEIEAQYAQAITKEKLNAKQQVLLKRKELIEGLFEKAGEKLKAFTESGEYERYLSSILQNADLSKAKILAREVDCALIQKLAPGCEVEPDPQNLLGGIVIVSPADNIYIDETFASKLNAKKEDFYSDSSVQLDVL